MERNKIASLGGPNPQRRVIKSYRRGSDVKQTPMLCTKFVKKYAPHALQELSAGKQDLALKYNEQSILLLQTHS